MMTDFSKLVIAVEELNFDEEIVMTGGVETTPQPHSTKDNCVSCGGTLQYSGGFTYSCLNCDTEYFVK